MPGMDGTGPSGQGPMTGGGFGQCNPKSGSGQRVGRGMGRGRGNTRFSRRSAGAGYALSNQPTDVLVDDEASRRNEELEMMLEKANAENAKLSEDNQKLRDFKASEKKGSDKKAK